VFICLAGLGRGRCKVSFKRKLVSENVWGKSIDDGERRWRWDSWMVTTTTKGVESVFRVSGTRILGKENVQRQVVEHTQRREREWKVQRLFFLFVYMLIYDGLGLDSQTKVHWRRLCGWKWNTNDFCNERWNTILIFESMSCWTLTATSYTTVYVIVRWSCHMSVLSRKVDSV